MLNAQEVLTMWENQLEAVGQAACTFAFFAGMYEEQWRTAFAEGYDRAFELMNED